MVAMTIDEAITLLTDETNSVYVDPDEDVVSMRATKSEYHALLALLESLRWRSVRDEPPPDGAPIALWHPLYPRSLSACIWRDEIAQWHGDWSYFSLPQTPTP